MPRDIIYFHVTPKPICCIIPNVQQTPPNVQKKRSIKPPSVQAQVVVRRANGESKTQIANDLGIARGTVYAILETAEFDQMYQNGLLGAAKLIPKALDVVDKRLDKGSESAAFGILNPLVLKPNEGSGAGTTNITYNFAIMQGKKEE